MTRKKKAQQEDQSAKVEVDAATATAPEARDEVAFDQEAATSIAEDIRQASPAEQGQEPQRGTPYRAILIDNAHGIELGENVRFRQRVLKFRDKPDERLRATLKESGFTFRPAEKAWTIPATPESREFTDRLMQEIAGRDGTTRER